MATLGDMKAKPGSMAKPTPVNKVDIIDASEMTAKILKEHLTLHNLLNPGILPTQTALSDNVPKRTFYVSDHNEFFETIAKLFFPEKIELKHYPLWE